MKQSQKTGIEIFEEIRVARKEFSELHEARDAVEEGMGRDTKAFRILSDCLVEAEQRVRELERQKYTVYIFELADFPVFQEVEE